VFGLRKKREDEENARKEEEQKSQNEQYIKGELWTTNKETGKITVIAANIDKREVLKPLMDEKITNEQMEKMSTEEAFFRASASKKAVRATAQEVREQVGDAMWEEASKVTQTFVGGAVNETTRDMIALQAVDSVRRAVVFAQVTGQDVAVYRAANTPDVRRVVAMAGLKDLSDENIDRMMEPAYARALQHVKRAANKNE
jgi:hypothetical protein